MKKIECFISKNFMAAIDKICDSEGYTRAEFTRRALEAYLKIKTDELNAIIIK